MPAMAANLEVIAPGPLSTVQDLGRTGMQHLGFSPGGATDRYAAALGNRLLQNDPAAAVIEITLGNASFRFHRAAGIAITGADASPRLDGRPLLLWQTYTAPAGSVLRFEQTTRGARTYLCMRGGVDVPVVLGSRSTDLLARLGGYNGRALRAGDRLPIGATHRPRGEQRVPLAIRPLYQRLMLVRTVPGPQDGAFSPLSRSTFFSSLYRVSPRADRTGLFLDGPRLFHVRGADILSEGVTAGSVQVPGTGAPLVLLAEHRSMGGYPKIATVCSTDLPRLGQARPGDLILFVPVDHDAARQARRALERLMAGITFAGKDDVRAEVPLLLEDWLPRIEAQVRATIADERLPLLLSDLDRLTAITSGMEMPDASALRVRGQVIAPRAADPGVHVAAAMDGTLLALPEHGGAIPAGAVLAAIWSPGICTLVTAGHPLARLSPRCRPGANVACGDVIFDGTFWPAEGRRML
jgi:antagonist of KipI